MKKLFVLSALSAVLMSSLFVSCDYSEKHDYGSMLFLSSFLWVDIVSPPNGSIVPTNTVITVVFSENINSASVSSGTFITSPAIPGTFSVVGSVVTLTPTGLLVPFSTYTVTMPNGGITATSGHSLAFPVQFFFSTNGL
jgi:hypothetical protein